MLLKVMGDGGGLFCESVHLPFDMEFKKVPKVVAGKMVDNLVALCQISCQMPEL